MPDTAFKEERESSFFNEKFYLSYSGLNKLLYSPSLFYNHYILNQREIDDNKGLEGRLVHCLLLTPDKFNEQFVLGNDGLISGKGKTVIDMLYEQQRHTEESTYPALEELGPQIIEFMVEAEYFQKLKDDTTRLAKMITPEAIQYWNHLWTSEGKSLVTNEQMISAANMVHMIRTNGYIMGLMGETVHDSFIVPQKFNEIHLAAENIRPAFGIHGIVDNLVIDHEAKEVRINDLKTTSKDITRFSESIETYRYGLQAAMYLELAKHIPEVKAGYKVVFRFIVVDPYMQVKAFRLKEETLAAYSEELQSKFDECMWHFENRRFDLPYEFCQTDDVVL